MPGREDPNDTNDTNEMWRAHHRDGRDRADVREVARLAELRAAREVECTMINRYHVRVRRGHVTADYWPRTGATRIGTGPTRHLDVPALLELLRAMGAA